jgi:hypothetical protein
MSQAPLRANVVVRGAMMMAGPVLVGTVTMGLLLFSGGVPRNPWLVIAACAFLTAVAMLAQAVRWTRRAGPSMSENFCALAIGELFMSAIAFFLGGWMFHGDWFGPWAFMTIVFAPFWLVGVGLAWGST